MATTMRDSQIDRALDARRVKHRPIQSRAALAESLLRKALGLPAKPAKANGKKR